MKTPDIVVTGINKSGIGARKFPNPHCKHCAWDGMAIGKSGIAECFAEIGYPNTRWHLCYGKDVCGMWEPDDDEEDSGNL